MDKVFRIMEIGMMIFSLIIGAIAFIGGLITGMLYCFAFAAMAFVLPYVWYVEDYKSNGKSLWQKKNTKN